MSLYLKARTPSKTEVHIAAPATFTAYDWKSGDFDLIAETADSVTITDTTVPIDTPRTFWSKCQKVANVYKNSDVAGAYRAKATGGVKCINSVQDVITILDDTDTTYRIDLPIKANITFELPYNELITDTIVQQQIFDAFASIYSVSRDGTSAVSRALKEARGAVNPL